MRRFLIAAMTVAAVAAAAKAGAQPLPTCKLPATGQTLSPNAKLPTLSNVKGADGDVRAGGALSYTDNGDGTITDNNTGLMWERKSAPGEGLQLPNAADLHSPHNCYPWQGLCSGSGAECGTDADCGSGQTCYARDCQGAFPNGLTVFKWVAALNAEDFAGHNDWRIPNVKELDSIVDYGTNTPAVSPEFNDAWCDSTDPMCITGPAIYWSATTFTPLPAIAWAVTVGGAGYVAAANGKPGGGPGAIFGSSQNGNYVRAVRGESCGFPASGANRTVVMGEDGNSAFGADLSYTDNLDGTITDNVTGLMWEKKVALDNVANAADLHDADNHYHWLGFCSSEHTFPSSIVPYVVDQATWSVLTTGNIECGTDADCPGGQTCIAADGQTNFPDGMTIFQWVGALNAGAGFAGHTDWRIPNAKELQSIVNYGVFSPSVSSAFNGASCGGACTDMGDPVCSCTVSASYWSSTVLVVGGMPSLSTSTRVP